MRNLRRNLIRGMQGFCVLCALCAGFASTSPAQITIHRFNGANGADPSSPPVEGLDTALYGTTAGGGANQQGTVYKLTPAGKPAWVYSFCATSGCPDGSSPLAGLVQGFYGLGLFGVTWGGGAGGEGTSFMIKPNGRLKTLNSFCEVSNCPDGAQPLSTMAAGYDGYYYGAALQGGAAGNYGVLFKTDVVNNGARQTLYTFCSQPGCADGYFPKGPLMLASDGNFYGTTEIGGVYGFGTVFQFNPVNLTVAAIYSFCQSSGCPDGQAPSAGVIEGADGNFYGVTAIGGSGDGVVFQLTPQGVLHVLHTFTGPDGHAPAGLIQATDGNLYGVTASGGAYNKGTLFELTTGGTFTKRHDFTGAAQPSGLMQKTDGNLYGTAGGGGRSNGYIFRYDTGLSPFVKLLPAAAPAGYTEVQIYGPKLTGATSVTFNGVSSTHFAVISSTLISADIPAGATSGPVVVTTPSGTLTSNVSFSLLP